MPTSPPRSSLPTGPRLAARDSLPCRSTCNTAARTPDSEGRRELYRAVAAAGAQILTVPSAFTERTGRDHWEVLLRARAIENAAYVLAPSQIGGPAGMRAYGHAMIIDPWGTIVAQAPDTVGIIR